MKGAAGAKRPEAAPAKPEAAPAPAPAVTLPVAPPVEAPKAPPVEAPKAPPVEKKPAPPPPPPPPSFVEANPEIVFGGGGILVLLLGYLAYSARRKKRLTAAALEDGVDASRFGTATGQSIDTNAALPTDFGTESIAGTGGDEGVDPVAEADVYIAYGRDSQAEEILLEALKTEPARCAIHLKLLEIYAARKNLHAFETVARDLHGLTGGTGPDWEKAAALGRSVDPANALYGGEAQTASKKEEFDAAAMQTMVIAAPLVAAEEPAAPAPEPEKPASTSLDFDLDLGSEPTSEVVAEPAADKPDAEEVMSLDFDLDLGETPASAAQSEAAVEMPGLDIDLGAATEAPAIEPPPAAAKAADEVAALDFDFNLGAAEPAAAPTAEPPALDLSAISLDLDETPAAVPAVEVPEPAVPVLEVPAAEPPPLVMPAVEPPAAVAEVEPQAVESQAVAAPAEDNPEVATKLELAQAYQEMGDKEGARELLNEVLAEGSSGQQQAARDKLAELDV